MTTLDEAPPAVCPDALHGPDSRARSRELGYAQAMDDMWRMLREMERDYKASAEGEANPFTAYALRYAEWVLGALGSYAYSAAAIHDTHRLSGGLDGFLQLMWRHQEAPREPSLESRRDGAR